MISKMKMKAIMWGAPYILMIEEMYKALSKRMCPEKKIFLGKDN